MVARRDVMYDKKPLSPVVTAYAMESRGKTSIVKVRTLLGEPCVSVDRTPNMIFKAAFAFA